ncbi:cation/H(+) antiporter 24-like [Gossypium arboreum]|nr:cation/H(+) antiporter 24-like [Gossypium arboreum]
MILGTIVVVGILTPLISILYDPSKPYMLKQRRTIQHTAQGDHLRILVCIRDKTNLPSLVNLLQLFHPTVQNPFSLHAFYLVELISRANPVFVEHQNQELEDLSGRFPDLEIIHHALKQYQEGREECVELHLFSAATVKPTMYQDVCKLALISKAVFIILPLKKKLAGEMETTEQWGGESGSIITQILDNAPCSVGLLVEKAERWQLPQIASYNFIVLFLGGPDSREALAFSDRMSGNPCVSLTVVRFLASNAEGDDEMQRKLDDGVVTSFWVKNEANEKVNYREVVIRNGADTASAIVGMAAEKYYHMWIVGRKQGINPSLLEGLSTWSDHKEEMGILGDYLSFSESVNSDSVMVVQKQVLTGKGPNFFTPPGSIVSFMRRGRLFW